jgi:hypothetical protein
MVHFKELYCAHVEQIGVRYPDAWHVRYAWAVDPTQIRSKVFFGDEAVVCTSVLEPDGTIRHDVEPYQPHKKKPAQTGFVPANL